MEADERLVRVGQHAVDKVEIAVWFNPEGQSDPSTARSFWRLIKAYFTCSL